MATYKPSDVFIGVLEFFGIILPGAVLVFLLQDIIAPVFQPLVPHLDNELPRWIAFLFASYIAGHFLHSLGFLLDRFLYDNLYSSLQFAKKKGSDFLLSRAKQIIVSRYGVSSEDIDHMNIFMWAGSVVRTLNLAASQELDRGGAESKFFRSWFYVFFVGFVLSLVHQSIPSAIICFVLTFLSLWRFMDLRWKNAQLTYEYFLILSHSEQPKAAGELLPKPAETPRHLTLDVELSRLKR
jgi:hypothetical protein